MNKKDFTGLDRKLNAFLDKQMRFDDFLKAVYTSKTEMSFTRYLYDYEKALLLRELDTDRLSRAEAIAKFKESKDLLDLGMVTQEEFSTLSKEPTPVIMDKQ
jgi:hypothetical protein